MAEISGFWTTGGATGDQQASYTQAQLAVAHRIMAGCAYFEGIAPSFLTELVVSATGLNEVTVGAGGAMVDGLWYYNDSDQTVAIPSASGSGNTRIDRIVLRADWANFNVSIHRIAGTDAASPTAPAITQNSGTIYDITVAQVLVDTAGNCTVIDEKLFAAAPVDGVTLEEYKGSLQVKAGGIGATQIASDAVDDTKAGNRVPQFYRRQGGATNWNAPGTTTQTPGAVRMQAGAITTDGTGSATVTFPVAFSAPPLVFITLFHSLPVMAILRAVSINGFTVDVAEHDGTPSELTVTVYWLAIGPE